MLNIWPHVVRGPLSSRGRYARASAGLTSGLGCPETTHMRCALLPSWTSLFCNGWMKIGLEGGAAPVSGTSPLMIAPSRVRRHDVRDSPPRFLAMTTYVPASSGNTSRISSDVRSASTIIWTHRQIGYWHLISSRPTVTSLSLIL